MDGCFCAWNIVNVAGNVFLTILFFLFLSFTYLVLNTFGNIQSMETQHKCEVTILIKQNLHVLMQILYYISQNSIKCPKMHFKMHSKNEKTTQVHAIVYAKETQVKYICSSLT